MNRFQEYPKVMLTHGKALIVNYKELKLKGLVTYYSPESKIVLYSNVGPKVQVLSQFYNIFDRDLRKPYDIPIVSLHQKKHAIPSANNSAVFTYLSSKKPAVP